MSRVLQHWAMGTALLMLWIATPASAQDCSHPNDLSFYSNGKYVVKNVRIESPIDFLHMVSHRLDQIKPLLPLKPASFYSANAQNDGRRVIREQMLAHENNLDPRSRLLIITQSVDNCHESDPFELDAVYWVFNTNYNSYLSHSWELKSDEIERPATTAAASTVEGVFTIQPFMSYNRTSQLNGGARALLRIPGGVFDRVQLAASGSSTSNLQEVDLVGSSTPQNSAVNYLQYRLGYRHEDAPSGNNRLREGTLLAQFFAATKPFGENNLILRFGASLGGGNRQAEMASANVSPDIIASSGYGSLKTSVGATLRTRDLSFAGSYGLQIGTRGATTEVDYLKHILDVGLTIRRYFKDKSLGDFHKSAQIEAQLTAGKIQTMGLLPVAERFFGGNIVSNFIAGDDWRIRSGPAIRSIPQNRLNAASKFGPIGGTSFYSINLTFSKPVWGYPIIPREMATDPQFPGALEATKASARKALETAYKNKLTAVFQPLINHLAPVEANLTTLKALLESLPQDPPEGVKEAASDVQDSTFQASSALEDKSTLPSKLIDLLKEANSKTCEAEENCSTLTQLRIDLTAFVEALHEANLDAASNQAAAIRDSLAARQPRLVAELDSLDVSEAQRLAEADMQAIDPILDAFLNEINLISISPVAIFDAARLWPDLSGTRFAVGGGVRLSLVNLNMTLGYAVNPNPRPQEGRGAFFFSMDITDIFR